MSHFITGVVAELITAFNEDGSIDYKKTGDLVDFQLACGVKNFFVNGLGGESHELSMDEQIACLKEVHSRIEGKDCKIMACAFEDSMYENMKLLDMYEETGLADCYCITAPPFFRHTQEALYEYASRLFKHVPGKPMYIYNCVQMGTLFDPDTLAKLWHDHENFRGYKDATVDMVHFLQTMLRIDKDKFDFLGGCDGLDGVMMTLGAVGCVSFMAIPFPKEMKAICDYGLAGDHEKCMEMQYRVLKLRNVLKQAPFNAAYMYAQNFTGGPVVEYGRMPLDQVRVSDEAKANINACMKELGVDPKTYITTDL